MKKDTDVGKVKDIETKNLDGEFKKLVVSSWNKADDNWG